MRAFVIPELTGPAAGEVREVPEPEGAHPWADGERLLIEVHATGVSFPDLLQSKGQYQHAAPPPYVAGGEVAGVVLEAPAGSRFAPGDRVASLTLWGGLAERALGQPAYTVKLPDWMSYAEGAALELNYATAWFALHRVQVRAGETVLVHGAAGGVGTATIQVAQALGATPIAVVSSDEKEKVAREAGADLVVRSTSGWAAEVKALTDGRGVDVVIDPVGGDRFTDSLRSLDIGGRLAVVGFAGGRIPEVKVNRLLLRDLSVVGVALAPYVERYPSTSEELSEALERLSADGSIRPVVGRVLPLEQAGEALALIERREALGKVVVRIHEESEATDAPRVVRLTGAHNIRDLGGLPTTDGGRTRLGRLFRSEFLAEPETLSDPPFGLLSLRSVVDLRRYGEVDHEQVDWGDHDIELHHVPLRLERGTSWHAGYHRYLVDGPERVVTAIRLLIDPGHQPALFHCAAGKDRTGVVAALLLDSIGAEREAIVADYAQTAFGLEHVLERLAAEEPYREQLQGISIEEHEPRPETMRAFLAWLDEGWGGARGWLIAHGIDEAELAAYAAVMVGD
jgi:NADPH2:quinone reductase